MTAVTQRIPNFLGGVSKQSDDRKFPGQVRECLNGYPEPTFGLTKRPGFKYIDKLETTAGADFTTQLDNSKWFYIHRDGDEKYIGCITPKVGGTNGTVYIWNASTGAACTITDGSTNSALGAHTYLTGIRTNYDVLTVQDTTVVTNSDKTVAMQATPTFVARTRATIMLGEKFQTDGSIAVGEVFNVTINDGSNDHSISPYTATDTKYSTVLTELRTRIINLNVSGITSSDVKIYNNSIQIDRVVSGTRTAFSITAEGGNKNNELFVFQDWAENEAALPPYSFHHHVVQLIGVASEAEDNYYARFIADDGVNGRGYWEETIAPDASPGLDAATMPHELVNTGTNAFTFRPITWTNRLVGDDLTNPQPSFVGKKITQAFFEKNRLGFLSDENVVLSRATKFFNFFHITARTQTADDPVDVSCSTTTAVKLHGVTSTNQGLVLFSSNQQFLLSAAEGVITPSTVSVKAISNYEMDTSLDPVNVGTIINFISKTPNYSRVFGMVTRGQNENPIVSEVGTTVSEWIPSTIDSIISSAQNQFIALSSQSSSDIYIYRTQNSGEETTMAAWFKWKLPGNVQTLAVDQDDMFTVTKGNNQYILSKADLSQSPEQAIIVNNQGQRVNPCVDLYVQLAANQVDYDSANDLSKCRLPYADISGLTPIIVFAGSTAAGSFVESGFTISPERSSDGTGPYFIIPGEDFSSSTNVVVGYKYDYDVELPKTYYNQSREGMVADYAAALTVARMKFSVGLSGVMGFKLKSTGRLAASKSHTMFVTNSNDGANPPVDVYTDYEWIESELPYVDQDQIKVKINNKVISSSDFSFQTPTKIRITNNALLKRTVLSGNGTNKVFNYTFTVDSTANIKVKVGGVETTDFLFGGDGYIIFNTAPPNASNNVEIYNTDSLLIYMDEWYNLRPTAEANSYLSDDVPLNDQTIFTIPIHQRSRNFSLRVFNDSPFPVSLNSMMWEGNYSPRFYRRT